MSSESETVKNRPTPPRDRSAGAGHAECQQCGALVSKRYARVAGDNDDVVDGCLYCQPRSERRGASLSLGTTIGEGW